MAGLEGKTLFITGASRGIGKAIGLMAAGEGANVVIASKTTEAHPKLPGTNKSKKTETNVSKPQQSIPHLYQQLLGQM